MTGRVLLDIAAGYLLVECALFLAFVIVFGKGEPDAMALPDWLAPVDDAGDDDARHLSAVCRVSASIAGVDARHAATPAYHGDQFTAERRARLVQFQARR